MGPSVKNFILYNVGWFATVYFAAQSQAWIGNCAIALVVVAHLLSVTHWRKEALFLAIAGLVGLAWETVLVWTGMLSYPASPGLGVIAPSWIIAMWVLFATTINVSLSWVKRRWWLAALFGGIGGPLAFVAGQAFGAVKFGDPVITPLVIGIGWAVLLPVLCNIADRIIASTLFAAEAASSPQDTDPKVSLLQQAQMLISGKGLPK